MIRGDLVLAATGGGFGGKPRPSVIIQADAYAEMETLVICLLTSDEVENAPTLRIAIPPDEQNNLTKPSWIMVDKIVTAPKIKIARRIGRLAEGQIDRLDQALLVFLGLNRRRA